LTSVGSLPTRVSTISETGSGADVTMMFLLLPFLFDEKLLDVSDIAEEAGRQQGAVAAGRLFSGAGVVPVLLDGDHIVEAQRRALHTGMSCRSSCTIRRLSTISTCSPRRAF
jgi:hypothetical protein